MVTTVRAGTNATALLLAGVLAAPGAVEAQECEFDGSNAASTASEAIQRATAEGVTEAEAREAYMEAWEALSEELDDDNPVVFLFGAQTQLELGNYAEAQALLERYDELAPPECMQYGQDQRYNGWVRLYNDGVSAYSGGDNAAALEAFSLANAFYPDLRSYSNAALLQTEIGDNAGAIATYQEALAADIADADPDQLRSTIRGLGDLLVSEGRTDEAMAAYEGYLADHPDDVVIRIRYAGVLADQGQADESQAIYADILQRTDLSFQQWVEVGVGLYNAQNYGDAVVAFEKARGDNPYNKEAMENYVNASVQAGRPGPVLALADTLTAWYPYDGSVWQLRASALAKADMDQEAMAVIGEGETSDLLFHFVQMASPAEGEYVVQGSFEGRQTTGPVVIPFEFLDAGGQVVATEALSTDAPPSGQPGSFRLEVQSAVPIAGFRYKKIGT